MDYMQKLFDSLTHGNNQHIDDSNSTVSTLLVTPSSSMLLMLQLEEEDFELDNDTENLLFVTNTTSREGLKDNNHLSLNAMKGGLGVSAIRFVAHINTLSAAPLFKVMVGNRNYMKAEGLIKALNIQVQGAKFELFVFLLPISGGFDFEGQLVKNHRISHIADYDALQLKFLHEGKFITLQGNLDSSPTQAHLHHIIRMVNTNSIAEVFSTQLVKDSSYQFPLLELPDNVEPELTLLLHTYSFVFDVPKSLPPPRFQDHTIPLMKGSQPVNVKPYRYPHSQKVEIEKLVQGMLDEGIIQPSKSLFSSLIIMVKKKDGSWRLFEATLFSKVDLRSGYHQILLNPEDRYKVAFRTHHGNYEWEINYLGHTLSGMGVAMETSKLKAQLQTPEQQQWLPKFLGFTIHYKPGKKNIPIDALSRRCFMI
ncbi:hypothetical protein V8G54_027055 [Vigna mungo]|uniref:Uncharacterized protein n=1 Tax=Vigna mungo TaxID=3915 RepID=A0AAQ3N1I2_VIGMU